MAYRDHEPVVLDAFNGLYKRGGADSCPLDHFSDCQNIQFKGTSSFKTRDGVNIYQGGASPLGNVIRIYNFITQNANSLLILDDSGRIYHVTNGGLTSTLILTIVTMTDFAFVPYAGRAYISPIATYGTGADAQERGITGEFLYVYLGDGT